LIKLPAKVNSTLHSKKYSKATVDLNESKFKEENVIMFVDIHGHSINDSIFMYGCKGAIPSETAEIKEIPYLLYQDLVQKFQDKMHRTRRTVTSCENCAQHKCAIHQNTPSYVTIFGLDNCKFSIEK
jgi:hypothetical protein